MSRANEPAYPAKAHYGDTYPTGGLTIREHFAGLAMQGLIANGANLNAAQIGEWAAIHADSLIAALEKQP